MRYPTRSAAAVCLPALAALLAVAGPVPAQGTKYFPADAEIIVTVDFRRILESDLVRDKKETVDLLKQMAKDAMERDENAKKFWEALGFDPFRDLTAITAAMPGTTDQAKAVVIVSGKFDAKKFQAVAEEAARLHGDVVKITRAGAHSIVEVAPPGEADKTFYLCLAEPGTLLISKGKATLTTALETGQKKVKLKKEVQALLDSRDPKASLSFLATSEALTKLTEADNAPKELAGLAPLLQIIQGLSGSVTVAKQIEFQLGIGTEDEESAKKLAQQASFGLIAAKAMVAQKAKQDEKLLPLVEVVKTLRATAQGSTIVIRGQVPAAVLEKALKNLPLPQ